MNCRNAFKVHTDNVLIPRSVCDEFASGVVGAAVEETVGAVAERREAHSSHRWTEGESAHGLPGAVSDEYGQFRSPLRDGLAPAR